MIYVYMKTVFCLHLELLKFGLRAFIEIYIVTVPIIITLNLQVVYRFSFLH